MTRRRLALGSPLQQVLDRLVGLVVKASACDGIIPGSSHTNGLKNWHSSGYPARCLAL